MRKISQRFQVPFSYDVYFTKDLFKDGNGLLADVIRAQRNSESVKILIAIDAGVQAAHPDLTAGIERYIDKHAPNVRLVCQPMIMQGGEAVKNGSQHVDRLLGAINEFGLDRHAYLIAIGGGSLLDMAGFAAAIAHRGVRHIRIPTTVLAQNDAGVGVKNGINQFGKKNFIGAFAPPFAVINDSSFLATLQDRDWRSGITEAIKVALIKDKAFFYQIRQNAGALLNRDARAMESLIFQCARLHLDHIASGDPFEKGSSRPLDFGHWAAHKLEQLTDYRLRHGEAVAIGIALDSIYSHLTGRLSSPDLEEILQLFKALEFTLFVPELLPNPDVNPADNPLFQGLKEFQEHLGGQLTIMLLEEIGKGMEVHEVDQEKMHEALLNLKRLEEDLTNAADQ